MNLGAVAAALFALTLAGTAEAQPRLARGTHELALDLMLDFEGPIGDTQFAEAGYGVFVRDGLVARGTLAYALLEDVAGADSDYRMREVGVAAEYHLAAWQRVAPYLGAGLGWRRSTFGKLEASGLVYGPRLGCKLFLADNVALDLGVSYRRSSARVFVNDFVPESDDLASNIGLRVLF